MYENLNSFKLKISVVLQGDEQLIDKLTNLDGINATSLKEDHGKKRVHKLAEVSYLDNHAIRFS